jgi:cob(I)alamin adenosyltransferase
MKIYTKKGDTGTTQLIGGKRIPKHDLRIESYGTVDELNSYIGLVRDQEIDSVYKLQLIEIQDRLFTIGSSLAAEPNNSSMKLPEIKEVDVAFLENSMDEMDKILPEMKFFVLPGGHTTVSFCHIARCVCRRAERNVTHLKEHEEVNDMLCLSSESSSQIWVLSCNTNRTGV